MPFEVKVPMVAIVVSFQFPGRAHRGLDGWRQTGGDRPASRRGSNDSGGQPGLRLSWLPRGMPAKPSRGRKSRPAVAGIRARRSKATTAFGQTCQSRTTWASQPKRPDDTTETIEAMITNRTGRGPHTSGNPSGSRVEVRTEEAITPLGRHEPSGPQSETAGRERIFLLGRATTCRTPERHLSSKQGKQGQVSGPENRRKE